MQSANGGAEIWLERTRCFSRGQTFRGILTKELSTMSPNACLPSVRSGYLQGSSARGAKITRAALLAAPAVRWVYWHTATVLSVLILTSTTGWPGDDRPSAPRFDPAGVRGSLVLGGGGTLPNAAREQFVKLAGGKDAKIVVIPTALDDAALEKGETSLKSWEETKPASAVLLHTRSRDEANRAAVFEPLKEATAVWFDDGEQARIISAYRGTAVEREIQEVLQRGGVIGGASAGAVVLCGMLVADGDAGDVRPGRNLLPASVIEPHFIERKKESRLASTLEKRPELFGMGIDEDTAVIVHGRNLEVVGSGQLTISLAKSANRPAREIEFKEGQQTDLTRWRLAARARIAPAFPAAQPAEPKVAAGSLVIVGGGGLPAEVVTRFVELAGGPESTIIVLPTANPSSMQVAAREGRFLERAGCKHVVTLAETSLAEVSSPEFLAKIKEANGVWFGGGRQWRFVDAYAETPAVEAFRDVLRRGGVIGGSSAGATIQGEYLVRGSPQGNEEMMAEGYERGFGFLPGTAIDQHFTQRKRQADLLSVMTAFPQLLGIGLDETTAIIVTGSTAEVLGKNKAHFYNTRVQSTDGAPECISLETGKRYDLLERKVVEDVKP
ncbi:MAG: cyanophycinase [Planctomycetaceae bacterium]|nr:cyanophycinase [Planctomycetaceae bacterium]